MSLDVYLDYRKVEVYHANITHNLYKMAQNCGIYYALWRPDEINAKKAKHIYPMISGGLRALQEFPEHYKQFDSPNGWGIYDHFVPFVNEYMLACVKYPEAYIRVSR